MARKAQKIYVGVNGKARKAIRGYVGDADGKARLFYDDTTVSVTFTKIWDDSNNWDGIRSTAADVQLMRNGQPYLSQVRVEYRDGYRHVWEHLPKRQDGEIIEYTVKEISTFEDYETLEPVRTVDENGNVTVNITNHHDRYSITVSVKMIWNDEESGSRPSRVRVIPYQDTIEASNSIIYPVYLSATNNWSRTWTGVVKYHSTLDHRPYNYTVQVETEPEGYTVSYSSETDENGNVTVTITNTLTA